MDINQRLLKKLNHTGFHSGTELGQELNVSRVAIKKRIESLIGNGVPIEALHGKGYRLKPGIVLLERERIESELSNVAKQGIARIDLLQKVDSTNQFLIDAEKQDLGCLSVCVAETQTAGRGRRGKEWLASPYRNILMSVSWQFNEWPESITGLGLSASVVIAELLNERFNLNVQIKWPNDLLVDQGKLAGLLVDVSGEPGGACRAVLGLGLNVSQLEYPDSLEYPVRDMQGLGCAVDRNRLIALILERWLDMLKAFSISGFDAYRERWNNLSGYYNKPIRVMQNNDVFVGKMKGVDALGALLLEQKGGEIHRFLDSSASVRLL